MVLSDEIRNYKVSFPLPAKMVKISREYNVLAILKYALPEQFSNLHKAEKPDLQDTESNLGIEVTSAISPLNEQITGESIKYSHAKTDAERAECLRIIKNCGGTRDAISTGYPVSTADNDKELVIEAFRKKMNKIERKRKIASVF